MVLPESGEHYEKQGNHHPDRHDPKVPGLYDQGVGTIPVRNLLQGFSGSGFHCAADDNLRSNTDHACLNKRLSPRTASLYGTPYISVRGAVLSLEPKTAEHAEVEVPQRIRFELGPWGRLIPEAVGHASSKVERPEAEAKTPADLSEQGQG